MSKSKTTGSHREIVRAEILKHKHTSVGKLMILMPVILIVLSGALTHSYFTIDCYNWWYMMMYPGLTALVCGSIVGKDKKMGNRAILSLPCDVRNIWDAKIVYGILVSGIATVLMTVLAIFVGFFMENCLNITLVLQPTLGAQAAACLLLWISFLWQIPYCMFLTQVVGLVPMLLIQMLGYNLMAAIAALKPFYMLMPGALASRMMCVVIGVMPNGLPARPGEMMFSPELLDWQSIPIGIVSSILWFLLLWLLSRKWYGKQVEKR